MIPRHSRTAAPPPAELRDLVRYRDDTVERQGWAVGRSCPQGTWVVDILDCEDRGIRYNLPAEKVLAVIRRCDYGRSPHHESPSGDAAGKAE